MADKDYPIAKPAYLYFHFNGVPMIMGFDRCDDFSPTWYSRQIVLFGDKIEIPEVELDTQSQT